MAASVLPLAIALTGACKFEPPNVGSDSAPDAPGGGGDDGENDDQPDGSAPPPTRCAHDAPFDEHELVVGINTGAHELNPRLSADERSINFTRRPAGGLYHDLYTASRDEVGGTFDEPRPIDELNQSGDEYTSSLSADGRTVYFDRRAQGGSLYDILTATRASTEAEFGDASRVDVISADTTSELEPFITPTGMYLASSRDGDQDLYFAPRSGGAFGEPEPLELVNEDTGEEIPVPSADGRALYFTTHGRPTSVGGYDIWVSTRETASGDFGPPVPVEGVVNTEGDEFPGWISPDNCRLYYTNNQGADLDIWVASRAPTK